MDQPAVTPYWHWFSNAVTGDFGAVVQRRTRQHAGQHGCRTRWFPGQLRGRDRGAATAILLGLVASTSCSFIDRLISGLGLASTSLPAFVGYPLVRNSSP